MRKINNKTIYAIAVFYIIAIAIRYLTIKTSILSGIDNIFIKIILQGIGPTTGVIVASLLFNIKFRPMTLKGDYKQIITPFSIYWISPVLFISAYAFLTKDSFPVITVLMFFIYGLLEEIGWRGFLQQQLKGLPKVWSILIIGILWFIWHLNFEMTMINLLFLGLLIFGSWGIGVVADKTNSLLAVSAFHTLNNIKTENNLIIILIFLVVWILIIIYSERKKKRSTNINIS